MIWQDIVITISNILFSYALIPQVFLGFKNKKALISLQTSTLTSFGLAAMSISFLTLGLYFSAIVSFVSFSLWIFLLIQGILYR